MVTRVTDTLYVLRILKMLTTDFKDHKAFELGFIDKDGNRIKYKQDPNNPNQKIENNPTTNSEKEAYTYLHRLVFNLKRIIQKVPFGRTKFASYAAALALLREEAELDDQQVFALMERIQDEFDLQPQSGVNLKIGEEYNLSHDIEQHDLIAESRSRCTITGHHGTYFGVPVYEAKVNNHTFLVTSNDTY